MSTTDKCYLRGTLLDRAVRPFAIERRALTISFAVSSRAQDGAERGRANRGRALDLGAADFCLGNSISARLCVITDLVLAMVLGFVAAQARQTRLDDELRQTSRPKMVLAQAWWTVAGEDRRSEPDIEWPGLAADIDCRSIVARSCREIATSSPLRAVPIRAKRRKGTSRRGYYRAQLRAHGHATAPRASHRHNQAMSHTSATVEPSQLSPAVAL